MTTKITPAVWNAVRLAVERHPGLLTPEGSVLTAGGTHLQTALRAKLLVPLQRPEVPGAPRGMVRREAGPTLWRLTPEAQVGLDKFLEGGAKVGGKRPQLTDVNVFALQELIARHQHTEEGGDFLESGVSARDIWSSPHVKRLLEFGALERVGAGLNHVRVTPLGRELARARFLVFEPPARGQDRADLERRTRLPPGRITYVLEKLGLDEAELDRIRAHRSVGAKERLARYQALLAGTAKSTSAGHSVGTALLIGGAIVGGLLLLRPLFRDAFEQHKWNMEHDPAYRASHQAMEISDMLREERGSSILSGSAGGRTLDRADVVRILAAHFRTHPRYKHWPAEARKWFYDLSIELIDQGADPGSALALTHGLAHNLFALEKFGWNLETTASIKAWPLRVPVATVAQALLSGKLKIHRRPVLSVATERRILGGRA